MCEGRKKLVAKSFKKKEKSFVQVPMLLFLRKVVSETNFFAPEPSGRLKNHDFFMLLHRVICDVCF